MSAVPSNFELIRIGIRRTKLYVRPVWTAVGRRQPNSALIVYVGYFIDGAEPLTPKGGPVFRIDFCQFYCPRLVRRSRQA